MAFVDLLLRILGGIPILWLLIRKWQKKQITKSIIIIAVVLMIILGLIGFFILDFLKAQDEVIEPLGLAPIVEQFNSGPQPTTLYGVTIMSPLEVKITGPDGKVLSLTQNDFGDDKAEYDDDPNDPDDPKVITLADLPLGTYKLTFTGTGTGPFTVIETYADDDETVSKSFDGLAFPGRTFTHKLTVSEDNNTLGTGQDPYELLNEARSIAKQVQLDKQITRNQWGTIESLVAQARDRLQENQLTEYYATLDDLENFADSLRPTAPNPAEAIMNLVTEVKINSPDL